MSTSEDYDSGSHPVAQLSTFRNTENVSIHGGTFSMTGNIAAQTRMDPGRHPQAHNGNNSGPGPHRSSRHRDQRQPYSRNLHSHTHQNGSDPGLSSSGARAPIRSDQRREPSATKLPTTSTIPDSQRATFGNADVANVSGGIFLNSHTVQLYHGLPQEGMSGPHHQDYNIVHAGVGMVTGTDRNLPTGRLARSSNSETNIPPGVRADYDIYYHQLLAKRRGSPMWIPGPDMNLPTEYRREGMRIGDVGILYRSEGFSFLFNIFLPAGHPINEGRVPPGFEPLNLSNLRRGFKKQVVFGPKSYLTSTSVATSNNVGSSSLIFETSAAENAVLIMPDGATTEDLMCRKSIKKYLAKNAETWYEFVSEVCELDVDNGDIRLVIGFDKVPSWGIATSACSIGERVRLEFKNIGDVSQMYTWHCVGSGSGRVGPSDREMHGIEADRSSPLQNQCVFLRTLNFDLSGKCWNALMNHQIRSSDHHSSDSASPGSHDADAGHQAQPGARDSGGRGLGGGRSHSTNRDVTFYATQSGLSVIHPSSSINKILLDKYPTAQMAITEDADWMSVITKDDAEIPKADELCTRLLSTREVFEEEGIVTFRSEDPEDTSSLIFASKNYIYDSDVAKADPFDPPPTESGKGPETRSVQNPSEDYMSAGGVALPATTAAPHQLHAQTSATSPPTIPDRSGTVISGESSEMTDPAVAELLAVDEELTKSLTSLEYPNMYNEQRQSHSEGIRSLPASPAGFQPHHGQSDSISTSGPLPSPPPSRNLSRSTQPQQQQKTLQPIELPLGPVLDTSQSLTSGYPELWGTQVDHLPSSSTGIRRMSPYPTPVASPRHNSTELEDRLANQSPGIDLGRLQSTDMGGGGTGTPVSGPFSVFHAFSPFSFAVATEEEGFGTPELLSSNSANASPDFPLLTTPTPLDFLPVNTSSPDFPLLTTPIPDLPLDFLPVNTSSLDSNVSGGNPCLLDYDLLWKGVDFDSLDTST